MASKVIIGGGTGFVGKHLGALLEGGGYAVTNVSRRPAPKNISWQQLKDEGLPKGTCGAVNLAGQNLMDFTKRWSKSFKRSIEVSRVDTTRMLAAAVNSAKEKPRALVVVTGVGAYAPSDSAEYDESSPISNCDFFSGLCDRWEDAARVNPPVRLVIIRSGVVLGRSGGMIKNMFLPFYLGLGGPIASGRQYLPWIHVDDLARLIVFALNNDKVVGVLNGVAPHLITNGQFTAAFARALNRPAFIPVPEMVLNLALNPERAMIMTKGQKVHPRRTLETGFEYQFKDIDSACRDLAHLIPKKNKYPLK